MKLARYIGNGEIAILEEPAPVCPPGGLLVRTEASGLCSGELMAWYMDQKIPHVLGHEVCGRIIESQDERFPVGHRVFVHHHAPCLACELCRNGLFVHCEQWKRTKLIPGGMAETFAASAENLNDAFLVDELHPEDAALIEPLACVVKSLQRGGTGDRAAVIGLGVMGLMHALTIGRENVVCFEIAEHRAAYGRQLGLQVLESADTDERFDRVFVCPGNQQALELSVALVRPGGTVILFSPLPPNTMPHLDINRLYFADATLTTSYSCGPDDTRRAAELLARGTISAKQVVSDFINLDELPAAYGKMKRGEILKPMVMF